MPSDAGVDCGRTGGKILKKTGRKRTDQKKNRGEGGKRPNQQKRPEQNKNRAAGRAEKRKDRKGEVQKRRRIKQEKG